MTSWTLIWRSLRFHARSHLGTLLGAAVGSAVLIGALVVGDSVRGSLRELALVRLGSVSIALASNDRFFRADLASTLADPLDARTAPAIQLLGTATTADNSGRANRVQVLGVDGAFWSFGSSTPGFDRLGPDEVALNAPLAAQLRVKAGDTILLRVPKPGRLSQDAPLSPEEDSAVALRLAVRAVVSDAAFGRFSLQASQLPPFNAFLELTNLQQRLGLPGKANLLLVSESGSAVPMVADATLQKVWQLADAELALVPVPGTNGLELRTSRVFLDPAVAEAAGRMAGKGGGVLTYFVNELRVGDHATPYSMVTAMGAPVVPPDMGDDEILISRWLADDLRAKAGDDLVLTYYVVGLGRQLEERSARFRVRSVLGPRGPWADPSLMPDFPGLAEADNCRDWDTGFPIQLDRIREKDERYWDEFRGTPKAFVTLAAGQKLWGNRFGNLTAMRFADTNAAERVSRDLLAALAPAAVGLRFEPVRLQALAAAEQSQDFGGLFIGFSFFLIIAALLLTSLLFQFGVEQRTAEVGTLLALGFTPRRVRRLLLFEGIALAVGGAAIGVAGGAAYARAMLLGLSTIWSDAVGTSALRYHADPSTVMAGAAGSVLVAAFTLWLALRRQARQTARELLAEGSGMEGAGGGGGAAPSRGLLGFGVGAALAAGALVLWALARGETAGAGAFFGAGSLLLAGGLALGAVVLGRLAVGTPTENARLGIAALGVRNTARRRHRSLATLGLLASGSFLIASIGVFRLDAVKEGGQRDSGTGGFALIGESSLPVTQDLNTSKGRAFFAVDEEKVQGVSVVPLRVRDGDDASCLNLNRAQKPRLVGVRPGLLAERGAFTFAGTAGGEAGGNPWLLLEAATEPDVVPAIGDANSIQWALGLKVGATLDYTDDRGRPFKIRLVGAVANSILQGNLLIDEREFVRRFPNESGYRMFLIDAPSNRVSEASAALTAGLQDVGLELTPATSRLAAFNAVQNTYLGTFQVLGGLGLVLGSVGLGVVVLRNVLERRGELALLLAVGFRPSALKWMVVSEHGALLLAGLGLGTGAAAVAVLPAVLAPGNTVPYASLTLTLGAVLVNGALWTWAATLAALRGRLVDALRNE